MAYDVEKEAADLVDQLQSDRIQRVHEMWARQALVRAYDAGRSSNAPKSGALRKGILKELMAVFDEAREEGVKVAISPETREAMTALQHEVIVLMRKGAGR